MKKPYLIFSIFIIISIIFALVFTCFSAREYHVERDNVNALSASDLTFSLDNNNVEVTDIRVDDDTIALTVKPLRIGYDCLEIDSVSDEEDNNSYYDLIRFYNGPFGTIFAMDPALNFSGASVVIAVLFFDIVLTAVFMSVMYVRYLRKGDFGYSMVACGGIALFTIIDLGIVLFASLISDGGFIVNLFEIEFGSFLSVFASFGNLFSFVSAPFMAVFSVAVTVSNLALIRREGFRVVNLLGVILGIAWLAGMIVNHFFDANSSGSSEHGRIFTSISSGVSIVISYFICMLFSTVISAWKASRRPPAFDRDYIAILGCAIRSDGTLTPLLRGRVDAALDFARRQVEKTGRSVKFVPSGGQGSDEVISESEAMKRYLLQQGVPEEQILKEDRSVNTMQNVQFSKQVIEADTQDTYNAAFATTNYHVFRGYILSKKAGLQNAQGISAKTKWYFFPNAFLRELAGLVVDKKKLHIGMVLFLMIAFALINALSFFG